MTYDTWQTCMLVTCCLALWLGGIVTGLLVA